MFSQYSAAKTILPAACAGFLEAPPRRHPQEAEAERHGMGEEAFAWQVQVPRDRCVDLVGLVRDWDVLRNELLRDSYAHHDSERHAGVLPARAFIASRYRDCVTSHTNRQFRPTNLIVRACVHQGNLDCSTSQEGFDIS